jgi:hypothetical protein
MTKCAWTWTLAAWLVSFLLPTPLASAAMPVIEFYNASVTQIDRIQPVRLNWKVQNAARVDIYDGFRNTTYPLLGSENYIEVWPERTATYTLIAYGDQNEVQKRDITIYFAPMVIEYFQASTTFITSRQPVRLWWRVQAASQVDLFDGFKNETYTNLGNENSLEVWPERTATYTLFVRGQGQTLTQQITVVVQVPPPIIHVFTASPMRVKPFENVRISWATENTISVDLENLTNGQTFNQLPPISSLDLSFERTSTLLLRAKNSQGDVIYQQLTVFVRSPGALDPWRSPSNHPEWDMR